MAVFLKNLATALASLDPGEGVGIGLPLSGGDSASNPKCMPANLHLARRHGRLADDRLWDGAHERPATLGSVAECGIAGAEFY
jgi:hypothetical protein